jgi:hypothetical protein
MPVGTAPARKVASSAGHWAGAPHPFHRPAFERRTASKRDHDPGREIRRPTRVYSRSPSATTHPGLHTSRSASGAAGRFKGDVDRNALRLRASVARDSCTRWNRRLPTLDRSCRPDDSPNDRQHWLPSSSRGMVSDRTPRPRKSNVTLKRTLTSRAAASVISPIGNSTLKGAVI